MCAGRQSSPVILRVLASRWRVRRVSVPYCSFCLFSACAVIVGHFVDLLPGGNGTLGLSWRRVNHEQQPALCWGGRRAAEDKDDDEDGKGKGSDEAKKLLKIARDALLGVRATVTELCLCERDDECVPFFMRVFTPCDATHFSQHSHVPLALRSRGMPPTVAMYMYHEAARGIGRLIS